MRSESLNETARGIRDGVEFMDELGRQVEALRDTLNRQLKAQEWSRCGLKLGKVGEDYESTKSGWAVRVNIDTFELQWRQAGRSSPAIYGAYQISLTPAETGRDSQFVPHVAVVLGSDPRGREFEQWECDEFQLDNAYLEDPNNWDGSPWIPDGEHRWTGVDGLDIAFVVPLVELTSDEGTNSLVIAPMMSAVSLLVERLTARKKIK